MGRRRFHSLSVLLAALAIGAQLACLSHVGRSTGLRAQAFNGTKAGFAVRYAEARTEADRVLRQGMPYAYAGLGLALASAVLWIISLRRREPGWQTLPPALLVGYVLTLFILV